MTTFSENEKLLARRKHYNFDALETHCASKQHLVSRIHEDGRPDYWNELFEDDKEN